jgi:hypothetical protein
VLLVFSGINVRNSPTVSHSTFGFDPINACRSTAPQRDQHYALGNWPAVAVVDYSRGFARQRSRNRGRQFTGNDLHDFGHATAARGYCHYFATDRSLCHLVVNKFDQRCETVVVAAPRDLLGLLDQI